MGNYVFMINNDVNLAEIMFSLETAGRLGAQSERGEIGSITGVCFRVATESWPYSGLAKSFRHNSRSWIVAR